MAPIISDCVQISISGTTAGNSRPWTVVQHAIAGGADPGPADIAFGWAQSFLSELMPIVSSACTATSASFLDLSSPSGASGPVTGITLPVVGGGSGTACPPNTSILLRMETIGSRSQRSGRMFLPGVDEDQVDAGGLLTSDYVDDITAALDDFQAGLLGFDVIPVVNSKASETTYEAVVITGMSVAGMVATQRRRLRK